MITREQKIKHVSLRMPIDLHAKMTEMAKQQKRSLHAMILWVCEEASNQEEDRKEKKSDEGKGKPVLLAA